MSPLTWVAFVAAGAVGAPLRYVIDVAVSERLVGAFPWGTLVINATGSFVLGLLTGLVLYHGMSTTPRLVLGTGFCGAYTTFSTFTFETSKLAEAGDNGRAMANLFGTLAIGAAAAAAGLVLAAL